MFVPLYLIKFSEYGLVVRKINYSEKGIQFFLYFIFHLFKKIIFFSTAFYSLNFKLLNGLFILKNSRHIKQVDYKL